jgi:hypothetical protein
MNSKPTTGGLALDQRWMVLAEPTKFILRCCELRKRRMGPSFLIPAAQRARGKSGN